MNSLDLNEKNIEKLNTFKALVENYNNEIALNYMQKSGWDETKAAQMYLDEQNESLAENINGNKTENNKINQSRNITNSNNDDQFHYNEIGIKDQLLGNEAKRNSYNDINNNNVPNRDNREGFFSRFFKKPFNYLTNFFCERGRTENVDEPMIISRLPNYVNDFQRFTYGIKKKLGILFVFKENETDFLKGLVERILTLDFMMEILKENCVIHSTLLSSEDGNLIKSVISSSNKNGFITPAIFFIFDASKTGFSRNCIMDTLQGECINLDVFQEYVIRNIEKKDDVSISEENKFFDINSNNLSNAQILEQQRRDLEKILKEEENKKRLQDEEEKRIQKENEERLQREKQREIDIKFRKEMKRKNLPQEPDESNPDSALIGLRFPHDGTILKRRLLKTDKIQVLYDLIDSLEENIFEESEEYDIIQIFPYKIFNDKDKTIEEEKLFPNAILQIKEKENLS